MDIVCQPALVVAVEMILTEGSGCSLQMWSATIDGQKINSYHTAYTPVEDEYALISES